MSYIKCLYGCLDTESNLLVGATKYAGKKFAFCTEKVAKNRFEPYLRNPKYKIVKLVPVIIGE